MKITLDPEYYTREAIANMASQFSDYMVVDFYSDKSLCLALRVRDEHLQSSTLIMNTFLNNILELSIQDRMNHGR